MIEYEDETLEANGTAKEITKDWMNLTYMLCEKLSVELNMEITIQDLIQGGIQMLKDEDKKNV